MRSRVEKVDVLGWNKAFLVILYLLSLAHDYPEFLHIFLTVRNHTEVIIIHISMFFTAKLMRVFCLFWFRDNSMALGIREMAYFDSQFPMNYLFSQTQTYQPFL